ncbi:MAG: zinc ribbon domain-containing protein [Verrucomicrobia bacterium]|nr:zinc ribbon domain-containing protein [Verrucomicrobiota bacterium]
MPIYEFSCPECQHDFELLVRSAKWKGAKCPRCGSIRISKKFSVFASQSAASHSQSAPVCPNNPHRRCGCGAGGHHCH